MKIHVCSVRYMIKAVIPREIADIIPRELEPFIDWSKLHQEKAPRHVIRFWNAEAIVISKQPFCVLEEDYANAKNWICSKEVEVPEEIAPFLIEEAKKVLF